MKIKWKELEPYGVYFLHWDEDNRYFKGLVVYIPFDDELYDIKIGVTDQDFSCTFPEYEYKNIKQLYPCPKREIKKTVADFIKKEKKKNDFLGTSI